MLQNELYSSINFLNELFEEFTTLIHQKRNVEDKEYQSRYQTFKNHLIQTEEYFYLNIYKTSGNCDVTVLASITNNLLRK